MEQASLIQYQQSQQDSQKLDYIIEQFEQDREEKLLQLKKQEEGERDQKFRDVLVWFSAATSTGLDHARFRDIRNQYPGTGEWILKDERIQKWMEDTPDSSTMWMNGIPGAGTVQPRIS
jgi:hypothetical protein